MWRVLKALKDMAISLGLYVAINTAAFYCKCIDVGKKFSQIRRKKDKVYLILYERKDGLGYHLDFTTSILRPTSVNNHINLKHTGFTGRCIIFEIKEVFLSISDIHTLKTEGVLTRTF